MKYIIAIFVFVLSIGLYYGHTYFDEQEENVMLQYPELFAKDIDPIGEKVERWSPTGLQRDEEIDITYYYTEEDQAILDERKRVLGALPFLNGLCGILSAIGFIYTIIAIYMFVSDWKEAHDKRQLDKEIKRIIETDPIGTQKRQHGQELMEKVQNRLKDYETKGISISDEERQEIEKELNHIGNYHLRVKMEYMLKQHLKRVQSN